MDPLADAVAIIGLLTTLASSSFPNDLALSLLQWSVATETPVVIGRVRPTEITVQLSIRGRFRMVDASNFVDTRVVLWKRVVASCIHPQLWYVLQSRALKALAIQLGSQDDSDLLAWDDFDAAARRVGNEGHVHHTINATPAKDDHSSTEYIIHVCSLDFKLQRAFCDLQDDIGICSCMACNLILKRHLAVILVRATAIMFRVRIHFDRFPSSRTTHMNIDLVAMGYPLVT